MKLVLFLRLAFLQTWQQESKSLVKYSFNFKHRFAPSTSNHLTTIIKLDPTAINVLPSGQLHFVEPNRVSTIATSWQPYAHHSTTTDCLQSKRYLTKTALTYVIWSRPAGNFHTSPPPSCRNAPRNASQHVPAPFQIKDSRVSRIKKKQKVWECPVDNIAPSFGGQTNRRIETGANWSRHSSSNQSRN